MGKFLKVVQEIIVGFRTTPQHHPRTHQSFLVHRRQVQSQTSNAAKYSWRTWTAQKTVSRTKNSSPHPPWTPPKRQTKRLITPSSNLQTYQIQWSFNKLKNRKASFWTWNCFPISWLLRGFQEKIGQIQKNIEQQTSMDRPEDIQKVFRPKNVPENAISSTPRELSLKWKAYQPLTAEEHTDVCENGSLLDWIVPLNSQFYYEK